MPKLHLVGITPDHRALVLSEHARAKRGDMVLEIDDRLLEAIDKAQRLRTFDEGHRLESNALPSKRDPGNGDGDVATRLTPREIQARLRAGESVAALARSSGTDEAWIRRFAAPVLAEQAEVVERARSVTFTKRGVGPSAAALGPAVAANVIDRGVALTLPDLEAAWGAYQHPAGGWHVTFTFPLRGRRQTAEWAFDPAAGELTARNKLATELGWRESGKKLPQPKPVKAPAAKRAAATKRPAQHKTPADVTTAQAVTSDVAAPVVPAPETTSPDAPGAPEAGEPSQPEGLQALPLNGHEETPPVPEGPAPRPSPTRKAADRKAPARPAPAVKRAAAAVTEPAERRVAPVVAAAPESAGTAAAGPMPPTDLDVVDVIVDLRDDETSGEPAPIGGPPAPAGGPPTA